MVIDTSAVVAILFEEEDQLRYAQAIEDASARLVSAVTRVELSFVVEGRKREAGRGSSKFAIGISKSGGQRRDRARKAPIDSLKPGSLTISRLLTLFASRRPG
jgi:uncharacterized protein with PIN domain